MVNQWTTEEGGGEEGRKRRIINSKNINHNNDKGVADWSSNSIKQYIAQFKAPSQGTEVI